MATIFVPADSAASSGGAIYYAANGAAALPSYTFTNDATSGLFLVSAGIPALSSLGVKSLWADSANFAVQVPSGFFIGWEAKSQLWCNTDGKVVLTNNAHTGFTALQFGSTTNAYPSLKRSGTTLAFRLADDSGDSPMTASTGAFSGAVSMTALTATTGTFSGAVSMTALTATTGTFSGAVSMTALTATTGTFSGAVSMTALTATTGGFSGIITGIAGTGAAPGVAVGAADDGLFRVSAGIMGLTGAGTEVARFSATLFQVPAAAYITFNGRAKIGSLVDNQLQVLPNAGGGSTAQILLNTADSNGSKIRNNGGGIINLEDGATSGVAAQVRTGQYFNNNGTYGMFFNTSATFGNGGNSATTVVGFATASLTAMSIGSTQNFSIYGTGGFSGVNSGAAITWKSVGANTTLSTGGTTTTILQIPAGATVHAVTAKVTTTITAALSTSWALSAGSVTYATGKGFATSVTVTSADYGVTFVGPTFYAAATNLVVTMNTDAATAGVVRCVVHYTDTTAPTA